MKPREYISFQTVDKEGDIWCNRAFLFESREKVGEFFNPKNPDFVSIFTDDDPQGAIVGFQIYNNNPAKHITAVSFYTEFAGWVDIREMSNGYLIKSF